MSFLSTFLSGPVPSSGMNTELKTNNNNNYRPNSNWNPSAPLIKLQSKDRQSGSSRGNASFTFAEGVQGTYRMISGVWPVSTYNINSTNNNFSFHDSVQGYVTGVLAEGFYTVSDLVSAMNEIFVNFSTSLTVSYNSITGIITIAVTSTNSWYPIAGVGSLWPIIGFNTLYSTPSSSYSGDSAVNLTYHLLSYHVTINDNHNFARNSDSTNQVSASFCIPVDSTSQSVFMYEPTDLTSNSCLVNFPQTTKVLNVTVTDEVGNTLNFESDWYFILQKVSGNINNSSGSDSSTNDRGYGYVN